MRVAFIMPSLPFPEDIRAKAEVVALIDGGCEVSVLCHGEKSVACSGEAIGASVERISYNPILMKLCNVALKMTSYRWHPLWSRRIRRFIAAGRFDVVHVEELRPFFMAARAAGKAGVPVSLDLREDYPEMEKGAMRSVSWRLFNSISKLERIQRDACMKADAVLVVSPMFVDMLHQRYPGVHRDKMVLVSNYADVDAIEKLVPQGAGVGEPATFTITYVGTIGTRDRGLELAIEAMPRIRESIAGAKLLLVGDGGYLPVLRRHVAGLGLDDVVEFRGWVDFEKVPDVILSSTVCIVPSLNSSFECEMASPLKLFQYMLLERPVVVSDCHEMKRIVEGSGAGLVFEAGDAQGFADCVIALADSDLRRSMGRNGRQAVLREFNFAGEGQRMLELYRSLAARGRG